MEDFRKMHWLLRVGLGLVTLGILLAQGFVCEAAEKGPKDKYVETVTDTLPLANASGSVSLSNHNGGIEVEVWDRPEVQYEARKEMKWQPGGSGLFGFLKRKGSPFKTDAEALAYFEELRVETEATESQVAVATHHPKKHIDNLSLTVSYKLRIPRAAAFTGNSHNGAVTVVGAGGAVVASTHNGQVACKNLGGSLDARTHNGSVAAQKVAGSAKASTHNGPITLDAVAGPATASTHNGKVTCRNMGGSVDAKTHNGAIHVDGTAGALTASTHNGGIHCDNINGTVNVKGYNSTIRVRCAKTLDAAPNVAAQTRNGGIDVALPAAASFALDARSDRSHVSNDFNLATTQELTKGVARGVVGDGAGKVSLHARRGPISLHALR